MIKIENVCGKSLNTRFLGASLKEHIMKEYKSCNHIILDFSNVKSISQSFADQSFGIIVSEVGLTSFQKNFEIINIKDDVAKMIKYVALKRANKLNSNKNRKSRRDNVAMA